MRTARAAWVLLAFVAMGFAFAARRGRDGTGAAELAPHAPPAAPPSPPPWAAKLPPPTGDEVEEGLRRAFSGAVRPAEGARGLVGDFNGDGAEDVAVSVRPAAERLADVNDELANWRVHDALQERDPRGEPPKEPPGRVQADEALLAVIHGYGLRGWRDVQARQCYLVRHAGGPTLEARPRSELPRYVRQAVDGARLDGDLILASSAGRAGFVYWTGARYAWHPLPAGARAVAIAR
jgi:hypothetical protein